MEINLDCIGFYNFAKISLSYFSVVTNSEMPYLQIVKYQIWFRKVAFLFSNTTGERNVT